MASALVICSLGCLLELGEADVRGAVSHPGKPSNNPQPSPLFNASFPPDNNTLHTGPSGAVTMPNTPAIGGSADPPPGSDPDVFSEFRFPAAQPPKLEGGEWGSPMPLMEDMLSPRSDADELLNLASRPKDPPVPTINEHNAAPSARVLSTTSIAGTPRSSGEFYSLSNNSTETLASEYVTHQPLRTPRTAPPPPATV